MSAPAPLPPPAARARLRRQMLVLATVLLVGGAVVLAFLDRLPLPLRLAVGLGDLIAAAVLFTVVRQKFGASSGQNESRKPPLTAETPRSR